MLEVRKTNAKLISSTYNLDLEVVEGNIGKGLVYYPERRYQKWEVLGVKEIDAKFELHSGRRPSNDGQFTIIKDMVRVVYRRARS